MYDSGQESCDSKQESENMNVLDKLVRDWTELLNLSMEKRQKPVKPPSPPVGQKKTT